MHSVRELSTRGALLREFGTPQSPSAWTVEDIDYGPPGYGEALVEMVSAGLCHSDFHYQTGDSKVDHLPLLGGHEGAGVVVELGPGTQGLAVGDHVVTTFMPACGHCRWCSTGRQNLCDRGAGLQRGPQLDGTHRVHADGVPVAQMTYLGTFCPYLVSPADSLIPVDRGAPLDKIAIVGCAVPTGWGSAVRVARTQIGDTVVVIGTGGVGMNAVQGASLAGARNIVAVDPVEWKRNAAVTTFGATACAATVDEAMGLVADLTHGVMADSALMHKDLADGRELESVLGLVSKGGCVVVSNMSAMTQCDATLSIRSLALMEKQVRGAIYGGCNPRADIPMLIDLYLCGKLKIDELITGTYRLDAINTAYQDMVAGRNLRGVITFADETRNHVSSRESAEVS
jgi:NDMA-dependent alcohol dehydrogenase